MTTVGVIGGAGRLGRAVAGDLRAAGYGVREYDLPGFDGADFAAMGRVIRECDVWINGAENPAHRLNADSPRQDYAANVMLPGHLGEHAAASGRYAIHLSTAAVFGGLPPIRPFAEEDEAYSIDGYERSRSNGEKAFLLHRPPGVVLRLGWLYGLPGGDFIERWRRAALARESLIAEPGAVGAPTPVSLVLRVLRVLIECRPDGIFHLAARGMATRAEVAAFVAAELKSTAPMIEASESTPGRDPVFSAMLGCRKIDALPGVSRPAWQPALAEYLRDPGKEATWNVRTM